MLEEVENEVNGPKLKLNCPKKKKKKKNRDESAEVVQLSNKTKHKFYRG